MANSDQLRTRAQFTGKIVEINVTARRDCTCVQRCAGLRGQHLPWHDIGMVFQMGDQNFVIRPEQIPVAIGNQVNRFRRSASEDDLLGGFSVDETTCGFPGCFECLCRPVGESVHSAMNIGIVFSVVLRHCIQNRLGFLCGCRIVQIHEWRTVDLLVENGKVGAVHQSVRFLRSASVTSSASTPSIQLLRNARHSRVRASSRERPRERR